MQEQLLSSCPTSSNAFLACLPSARGFTLSKGVSATGTAGCSTLLVPGEEEEEEGEEEEAGAEVT